MKSFVDFVEINNIHKESCKKKIVGDSACEDKTLEIFGNFAFVSYFSSLSTFFFFVFIFMIFFMFSICLKFSCFISLSSFFLMSFFHFFHVFSIFSFVFIFSRFFHFDISSCICIVLHYSSFFFVFSCSSFCVFSFFIFDSFVHLLIFLSFHVFFHFFHVFFWLFCFQLLFEQHTIHSPYLHNAHCFKHNDINVMHSPSVSSKKVIPCAQDTEQTTCMVAERRRVLFFCSLLLCSLSTVVACPLSIATVS